MEQQQQRQAAARFTDVVGIVTLVTRSFWPWRHTAKAVRLTCKAALQAHDAAQDQFSISVDKVARGQDGAAEIARFLRRLPTGGPRKLHVIGAQVPEDHLLMVVAAFAPAVTTLKLGGTLHLQTPTAAAAFASVAAGVTDLQVVVTSATATAAIAALLGLMGGRLRSLTLRLRAPDWDVDALAMLGVCRELQHLEVLEAGGRKQLPLPLAWLAPLRSLRSLDLSGTTSTDSVTDDDAAAIAGMTALTSLVIPTMEPLRLHNGARLRQLYETIGALRHLARLDLGGTPLGDAALAGLACSPVTELCAGDLDTEAGAALPPGLVKLSLDCTWQPSVAALAGLAPAPASLQSIEATNPDLMGNHICLMRSSSTPAAAGPGEGVAQLHDSIPGLMPAAVSVLAGRIEHEWCNWFIVGAFCDQRYDEPPRNILAGGRLGHAAWLQHLGPLQCSDLVMIDLALAPGDFGALAAALPRLEVLRFERCTFTPSALLELAPLSRLKHIGFRQCDESMGCPRAMAMLAELCYRLDAITQAEIAVDDIEEQRPGDFMWRGAASQAQAALEARGKVVVVEVDEVS